MIKDTRLERRKILKVKGFTGGNLAANGYVVYQSDGESCYIIDPGYNPKKFIKFVQDHGLTCRGIILTHLHHDHTGAAENVSQILHDCPIYMHEADAFIYKGRVDHCLTEGCKLDLDGEVLRVIHTPGHTQGSICVMAEKSRICFTGDTLFDTDLGRSDLAGGDEKQMEDTVRDVLDKWENDVFIYPGHDGGCTMKQVRKYNTEFLALRQGKGR